jgi:hypothetical protein
LPNTDHAYAGRFLWAISGLLITLTVAAAGLLIWFQRQAVVDERMMDVTALTALLADHTAHDVQIIDLVLSDIQSRIIDWGINSAEQFQNSLKDRETNRLLRERQRYLTQGGAIGLYDAAGQMLNVSNSWPVPAISATDRDYYRRFVEHDDATLFVGAPIRSRVTGSWTITLSRRITGPRGEFLGMAVAGIELRYVTGL